MKTLFTAAVLVSFLAACGGGGSDSAPQPQSAMSTMLPTVYLPDGTVVNSCSLEPLCSGIYTFPGSYKDYTVTRSVTGYVVTSGQGVTTPLAPQITRLHFDDGAIALDIDGTAGQVYRLYQAAFNRQPDLPGIGFWINAMGTGMPFLEVANAFYQSPEFKSIYGVNPTYSELVTRYYRNALRREPDPAGFSFWVNLLTSGVLTPAQVLVSFSESLENKARVLGAIQFGIVYIPPTLPPPPPPPGTFQARVTLAPPNGGFLAGTVRLEVRGAAMQNVELLPANGYAPRYGIFNLSPDRTVAALDLDTTALPNGPFDVRISAFNVPAGQPNAAEIIAMPARRWEIRNNAAPPAAVLAVTSVTAPAADAVLSGTTRLEVRGSGLSNVELLPANSYTPRLGVFNVSADKTFAWMDFDPGTLPNGPLDVRISAFNVPAGQANAAEIVAMPPRRWQLMH
jgi:Domain of unknown function (DUF4214)